MSMLQPIVAPKLKVNNRIQYAFRYIDKDDNNKENLEQYTGTITEVSIGDNLYQSCKPYHKDSAVEV